MSTDRWDRLEALFEEALALPPDARRSLIDAEGGDDPELRQAVESLLEADRSAAGFLARPARIGDHYAEQLPSTLGAYQLLEMLAEGEMSSVYLAARDDDTFERRVVIKVVRRGAESFDVLRRLRLERQILARLDHPSIAKLHDGGTTPDQRPYFVMEHVEGLPIDRFADQSELTLEARVSLLRRVAKAVHVAHQNLIIHRDLKPSNILVTADGTPKLLDFGIAKIVGAGATAESIAATRRWQRLLTPAYASPEQLRGEPLTIAADVYALGVILYELLCDRRPRHFDDLTLEAMARTATNHDAQAPSRAVANLTVAERKSVAAARRCRPDALAKHLRGDLDAIVLKALRPAPARRYASALAMAEDLERWGAGLPVHARRGGLLYRGLTLAKRHRRSLTACGLLVTLAISFATGVWRHNRALDRAQAAQVRARLAQSAFLETMIDSTRAVTPKPGESDLSMRQVLQRLEDRIGTGGPSDPQTVVATQRMIATIYANLGDLDASASILGDTLDQARASLGRTHPETVRVLSALGVILGERGDSERGLILTRTAVALTQTTHADAKPKAIDEAALLNALVGLYCIRGDYALARPYADRALALTRGFKDAARFAALVNGAQIASNASDHLDARRRYADALAILDTHSASDDPRRAAVVRNLGAVAYRLNDYETAVRLGREALEHQRQTLGPRHPDLAPNLYNLANAESRLGEHSAAEQHLRIARDLVADASPASPRLLLIDEKIAQVLADQGRDDAALIHLRSALRSDMPDRTIDASMHPYRARLHLTLGRLLVDRGRAHEARRHIEIATPILTDAGDQRRADEARSLLRDLTVESE